MPEILNPFSVAGNAFSMAAMTESIIRLPYNMYGRVGQLGIFSEQGVTQPIVLIEEMGGVLNLLPTTPRGAPSLENNMAMRTARAFPVPHIALDDVLLPDEVQGVRSFGSVNELETLSNLMMRKLQTIKNKHAITLEWHRVNALKGILLDADGSTVIANFFTAFGITPFVQNFQFSSPSFDVMGAASAILNHIDDNLHGEVYNGTVRALCSATFWNAFMSHPNVKIAFQYYQTQANQNLAGDYRTGFNYGGIIWEQYRGVASDASGTAHKFIADGTAQFVPMGTQTTFATFYAPADFNETVNTIGLPMYAKQEPRKFGRGTDVHTQMNPLNICRRPELLVQGTTS